jgi:hypothetical protein
MTEETDMWTWQVQRWRRLVRRYFRTRFDRRRALAIIRCESNGDPWAVSGKEWVGKPPPGYDGSAETRCSGLFQQVPYYWPARLRAARIWYAAQGVTLPAATSIFNPELNIAVAAWLVYDGWHPETAPNWQHWSGAHVGVEGCLEWAIKQGC